MRPETKGCILVTRKQLRFPKFDYGENGAYFITICTLNRECQFGEVIDGKMTLGSSGKTVQDCILRISEIYSGVSVEKFTVMPNHVHLILLLTNDSPDDNIKRDKMLTLKIVQQLKSASVKLSKDGEKIFWQRSYYDHVVRSEKDLLDIWPYIDNNPMKWELDKYYTG